MLIASAVHLVTIPLWGALSDRIGRKPVYILGAVGIGVWAFAFFSLLDTDNFGLTVLAITVGLLLHGAMYGPQAAFFSELFGTKARYTGVGRLPAGLPGRRGAGADRAGPPGQLQRTQARGGGDVPGRLRGGHADRGAHLRRDPQPRPRGGQGRGIEGTRPVERV